MWSQNSAVVRLQVCHTGLVEVTEASAFSRRQQCTYYSDLWRRGWRALNWLGLCNVVITHVDAHRVSRGCDFFEDWVREHNQAVDHAAVLANQKRGGSFDSLYDERCQQVDLVRRISRSVQRGILAISRAAFRMKDSV